MMFQQCVPVDQRGDYLKYQIGRLFYARMGQLLPVLKGEETLNYSGWFSDPEARSGPLREGMEASRGHHEAKCLGAI